MRPRYKILLEKSVSAMLAAIEVYNKPDFRYREETFAILCINSWELLLKAKLLNLSGNNMSSLYVYERRTLKNGFKSTKKYIKKNRSGSACSLGLIPVFNKIVEDYDEKISLNIKENLKALCEVRDHSIHLVNIDLGISKTVQELGSASLCNYKNLVVDWFGNILGQYNFFIMPISFFRELSLAEGINLSSDEQKMMTYLHSLNDHGDNVDYSIWLKMAIEFEKGKGSNATKVQITSDPNAPKVQLSDQNISDKWPWTYNNMISVLRDRYSDFKLNDEFHKLNTTIKKTKGLTYTRYLNPNNKTTSTKIMYSTNVLKEFDKHYTKKKATKE